MRDKRLFAHDPKGIVPRMSWSSHNLYNLIARSMPFYAAQASFKKTGMTMYQQRWRSKRLLRGYHGDWIREKTFKRWYLPVDLPRLENTVKVNKGREASGEERMPVPSLFLREVERRLDTVVFRCCFARSAREARSLVLQGKVKVNGNQVKLPGTLLNPDDLISVEPEAIPMLSKDLQIEAEKRAAARMSMGEEEDSIEVGEEDQEGKIGEEEVAAAIPTEAAAAGEGSGVVAGNATAEEGISESAKEAVQADGASSEAVTEDVHTETPSTNRREEKSVGVVATKGKGKDRDMKRKEPKKQEPLLPGQLPFNLPTFATPFLFIPPYLEVSFTTCSAIYMRHPTITPVNASSSSSYSTRSNDLAKSSSVSFKSDLPSPYPASGEIFSLAWEHYARNSPRIRSDLRRLKVEAKVGREGIQSARAKDAWKKVIAIRRGHDKESERKREFVVGSVGKRRTGKNSSSGRFMEKGQARGKGIEARV